MSDLRRQHQELLSVEVMKANSQYLYSNKHNLQGGPSESMSIMYGTLLRKYETIKEDFGMLSKRYVVRTCLSALCKAK